MPELPEVETVMRGLEPVMCGAHFAKVTLNRPDLRWPFPDRLAERITHSRINALSRRSKYILADLSSGETLLLHLGMSGRILISGDPQGRFHHEHPAAEKHDHVVLDLDNGARITFNDPRRFGALDLIPTDALASHKLLAHLGPEPLSNHFTPGILQSAFRNRRTPVKTALLDQRIIAGLGNIYVCEALWRTGIAPTRHAGRIAPTRVATLVPAIRDILNEAIAAGGSSLRDYRRADGELGYFQHRFSAYDREGEACLKEGCGGTIKRITQSGRSTFFCPSCQR